MGVIGWVPPKKKGQPEQPRWSEVTVDIDEAFSSQKVAAVLDAWTSARLHEAPAFSGGVVDAWPALMVDGLAVCRAEENAIDDWQRHVEASRG